MRRATFCLALFLLLPGCTTSAIDGEADVTVLTTSRTATSIDAESTTTTAPSTNVALPAPPAEPVEVSVSMDLAYLDDATRWGFGGGLVSADTETVMHRFLPEGEGPWPVVVLLHGGDQMAANMGIVARALAERGLIVYVPSYLHDFPVNDEQVAAGAWAGETLIGDLACSIRVARDDATAHNGRPDRLVLVGYSMGAAFGATVALVGDDPEHTLGSSGICLVAGGSATPVAFVGWEGPYDVETLVERAFPATGRFVSDEAVVELSPLSHGALPPPDDAAVFHLRAGDLVFRGLRHSDFMERFARVLDASGWSVTSGLLPGREHADFIAPPLIPEMLDLIVGVAYDQGL